MVVLGGGAGGFELRGGSIFSQSSLCFMFPVLRANLISEGMALLPLALCILETTELEDVQWRFPATWVFPGSPFGT